MTKLVIQLAGDKYHPRGGLEVERYGSAEKSREWLVADKVRSLIVESWHIPDKPLECKAVRLVITFRLRQDDTVDINLMKEVNSALNGDIDYTLNGMMKSLRLWLQDVKEGGGDNELSRD